MSSDPQPPNDQPAVWLRLLLLFALALTLRVGVALWLDYRNQQRGVVHEFPDSELYWKLALQIADGGPFFDGKRYVQRTPGYPLFLAGCIRLFGPSLVGARHAQAALGAGSCLLLFCLVRKLTDSRTAWIAAMLAAVYPYAIFLSAVLLSEALFGAVLLVQLLLLAQLFHSISRGDPIARLVLWSAVAGLCGAAATLVRPSWLIATPLFAMLVLASHSSPLTAQTRRIALAARLIAAVSLVVGLSFGMLPWWIRNWRLTGHPVLTTLWVGASLYDGLGTRADGASHMDFMERPDKFGLDPKLTQMDEWEQDQYLRREAFKSAKAQPLETTVLAGKKLLRFWNPLPNAAEGQSWPVRLLSLASAGPVLLLSAVGCWFLRRRGVVLALLAGPVLYFCVIHLVFVSSIRYREAAMLPVLGLAAAASHARRTASSATRR